MALEDYSKLISQFAHATAAGKSAVDVALRWRPFGGFIGNVDAATTTYRVPLIVAPVSYAIEVVEMYAILDGGASSSANDHRTLAIYKHTAASATQTKIATDFGGASTAITADLINSLTLDTNGDCIVAAGSCVEAVITFANSGSAWGQTYVGGWFRLV